MTLILDAGALIAVERGDRELLALLKFEHQNGRSPLTHGGVVGQVWRNGSKQANLASALRGITTRPLDDALGRQAGLLLRRTRGSDVIDAAIVMLANDGDTIFTSDLDDIQTLCSARDVSVDLVHV